MRSEESKVKELTDKYCNDHESVVGDIEDKLNNSLIRYRAYRSGYIAAMELVAEEARQWGELQKKVRKMVGGDQKEADREHHNQMSQLGVILCWARKQACHETKEIWDEIKQWDPR